MKEHSYANSALAELALQSRPLEEANLPDPYKIAQVCSRGEKKSKTEINEQFRNWHRIRKTIRLTLR
jgi:hypothetical protein